MGQSLSLNVASYVVSLFVRLLKASNLCTYIGFQEYRNRLRKGERVLIAFWHNQGLFMPFVYFGKGGEIKLIVSQSRDGELIAALLKWFGILSVRGSSSRGGTAALKELVRLSECGDCSLVFTPDGPKGPIYCVKEGVAYLASRSGKPLYLLSVDYSKAKVLGSWDKFRIPLPFGRAYFVCSPPLVFPNRCRESDALEKIRETIEKSLLRTNEIATALASGQITVREAEMLVYPDVFPFSPTPIAVERAS